MRQRVQRRDRGLSLIELVVAMAVFALVAIMGLQSLAGMLHMRDRLTEMDDETAALSRGLALMRNDLSAVVPMLFYPPDRAAPQSALGGGDGTFFALSIGGQPELSGRAARHRAEWRIDPQTGMLARRVWTTLTPAEGSALRAEVPLLEGVSGLQLRSYWQGQGWVDGLTGPLGLRGGQAPVADEDSTGGAPEVYSDTLPEAIEVTLVRPAAGDLILMESFR